MGAGEAAAQCSGVPSVPKKRRDTSQLELLGAHPRDPQEMSVPLPIQKSHMFPRRAAQEGHLAQTPLLSRVHFTHTVCTGTVPTNTGLSPALHRTAGNGVQLGQTPTALGSPSLNSLPSSQPPKREAQTSWVGLWSGGPSEPLLALFVPTRIHTEAAGADPTQPVMVMLGFSHPGQQRETPLTAWLGLFGHHFGHSPGIACSSCVP